MSLLARLILPWSNPLPAQLSPACLAGGPCSYKFQPCTISTGAQQWPEKPKMWWLLKHPHFTQHNRSVPDPSPCSLDTTQTKPKSDWALLLLPAHFWCLELNFLTTLAWGWKYLWSQAGAANGASHVAPVQEPCKGHFICIVVKWCYAMSLHKPSASLLI